MPLESISKTLMHFADFAPQATKKGLEVSPSFCDLSAAHRAYCVPFLVSHRNVLHIGCGV